MGSGSLAVYIVLNRGDPVTQHTTTRRRDLGVLASSCPTRAVCWLLRLVRSHASPMCVRHECEGARRSVSIATVVLDYPPSLRAPFNHIPRASPDRAPSHRVATSDDPPELDSQRGFTIALHAHDPTAAHTIVSHSGRLKALFKR